MSGGENKLMRRRLANAYLSAVISISLVLLLVGVASLLLVNAKSVSDYFKENMQISVLLKPETEDEQATAFQSELDSLPYVHSTRFETSPVPSSLELTLKAEYVSSDSLEMVKKHLLESPLVDEVDYQQSLIETLNENIGKISLILGVFIVLLLFISFVLINNTVRLNVFARRFTIHTMKMVGATRSFIRSPFMVQAVFQGLFAAFLAIILLLAGLFFLRRSFEQMFQIFQLRMLLLTIGIVIASGVVICVVSTYFVVNKLVSLKRGELYY